MLDLTPALPTFVITLREGVEAALVVGIVLAYLKKASQTHLNLWVYSGVAGGLLASLLVGVLFGWLSRLVGAADQTYAPVFKPLLEGVFSLVAIAMLSWMLIWMTQQARLLKTQIEGAVGASLNASLGAGWSIFGLIFFAVLREGFETVLFITARFQQGWVPILGAIAGIVTAVAIGVLLFQWGVKINLRQFFQVMGVFLLLIVAGLVISTLAHLETALHTLAQLNPQFERLCLTAQSSQASTCILGPLLWDTHRLLPERQFPGIILHTLFGYEDQLYLVQAVSYISFLSTVGLIYLRSLTTWSKPPAVPATTETSVSQP